MRCPIRSAETETRRHAARTTRSGSAMSFGRAWRLVALLLLLAAPCSCGRGGGGELGACPAPLRRLQPPRHVLPTPPNSACAGTTGASQHRTVHICWMCKPKCASDSLLQVVLRRLSASTTTLRIACTPRSPYLMQWPPHCRTGKDRKLASTQPIRVAGCWLRRHRPSHHRVRAPLQARCWRGRPRWWALLRWSAHH